MANSFSARCFAANPSADSSCRPCISSKRLIKAKFLSAHPLKFSECALGDWQSKKFLSAHPLKFSECALGDWYSKKFLNIHPLKFSACALGDCMRKNKDKTL